MAREILSGQKSLNKNFKKQESDSEKQKRTSYVNSSHVVRAFEVLDSLRKDAILCDIKLETNDGILVYGHKVVLASATPYFQVMFTSFEESKKSHVILRELDSTTLQLLIDFIYTGQILITDDNAQVLLQAANLLQLHGVKEACCDFLQTQLNLQNCFIFKSLLSLYHCVGYVSSFKSYILHNFSEVVEGDEYLYLPCDELIELISSNELNDSSEEKVFECVVNWVNHDLSNRKNILPRLMEHVRLPLVSKEYLCNRVREEPLLKSTFECRDFLEEALYFHISKSEKPGIRTKHRQPVGLLKEQVVLIVGRDRGQLIPSMHWLDTSTNKWQLCSEIISIPQSPALLAVLNDQLLFYLQNDCKVYMMDLFSPSPCFKESVSMSSKRIDPGIGALDNCIYVVGGGNNDDLKSAEVFNFITQDWKMISEMSTARIGCGVGVFNHHIYAVGGISKNVCLKSVERYCPRTDTWAPVAGMNERRSYVGIGIVNGVMYAVGGFNEHKALSSVEAYNPSSNTWTFVSDMHKVRGYIGVVTLNDLLYVVSPEYRSNYSSEMYDPKSNIWTMITPKVDIDCLVGAVVVNRPPYFKT